MFVQAALFALFCALFPHQLHISYIAGHSGGLIGGGVDDFELALCQPGQIDIAGGGVAQGRYAALLGGVAVLQHQLQAGAGQIRALLIHYTGGHAGIRGTSRCAGAGQHHFFAARNGGGVAIQLQGNHAHAYQGKAVQQQIEQFLHRHDFVSPLMRHSCFYRNCLNKQCEKSTSAWAMVLWGFVAVRGGCPPLRTLSGSATGWRRG